MKKSPYENLPSQHFWKTAVAQENVLTTTNFWRKKVDISLEDTIVSAGSCFAQHISRRLVKSGYQFLDVEPPPQQLPAAQHTKFGFSTYSARYGNIYTAAQLIELAEESLGLRPQLDFSWEKRGRFYDPLRPNIEPNGLISHEEVKFHRLHHLKQVRRMLESCNVFVFTLGLTEAWICKRSGRTLPTAPGTVAGDYYPDLYEFKNFTHSQIKADFTRFMELVWSLQRNRSCRFLLTVSPVPLAATATHHHVLVATTYSKSTLRSVAGELYDEFPEVDYFPSYEIITAPWSRGLFYESDMRNVASAGVDAAMRVFFLEHNLSLNKNIKPQSSQASILSSESEDDAVVCEEALLEGFSK